MNYDSEVPFKSGPDLEREMGYFKRGYYSAHTFVTLVGAIIVMALAKYISYVFRTPALPTLTIAAIIFLIFEGIKLRDTVSPSGYKHQLIKRAYLKKWLSAESLMSTEEPANILQHSGIGLLYNPKTNEYKFVKSTGYLWNAVRDTLNSLEDGKDYQVLFFNQEDFRYIDMSSSVPGYAISNTRNQPLGQMELMIRYGFDIH